MASFINFDVNMLIISNKSSKNFKNLLEDLKINYVETLNNEKFNKNYNDHPDISLFYFDDKLFVDENVEKYYREYLDNVEIVGVETLNERSLNISYNNRYFFHNEKFKIECIYKSILKEKNFINIKQGYSNCSMICFENSIITSDVGIYNSLKKDFDIHLVTTDGISLNGYENGFIGGTCGFISKDKLLFYADVTKYRDYDIIKLVSKDNNVDLIFPKDEEFVDLGSIISLK